jgi:Rps23 Pro-64 3,4-dihydroxylase Tpa1-like proline 4-hydroxylase
MISDTLGRGKTFKEPFPYYVAPQALTEGASNAVLNWLENDAPWHLAEESFYEQYEFNFHDVVLPQELSPLMSPDCLQRIKEIVEQKFGVEVSEQINFSAHKLAHGQRIRVHNDYRPGYLTHRLLIQLNRDWADENGGLLVFFNSRDAKDVHKAFRPLNNSCVAFAVTENSFHAVSTITQGERFTLVFSFYAKDYADA